MSHPYATEAERHEARRKTYRESKARAAEVRQTRRTRIEAFLDRLISSGQGDPARRQVMLDLACRRVGAA